MSDAQIGDQVVYATDGSEVAVSLLWQQAPALVVFLRHYGWMFCREQAAHYEASKADFEALGVNLVAIGNGTAPMAKDFVRQFSITFPVYTDPKRMAFRAAGMKYQSGMKLRTFKYAARALAGGHIQGLVKGRPKQQGGVLLVNTEGDILYEFQETGPGEHQPATKVLQTVRRLLG